MFFSELCHWGCCWLEICFLEGVTHSLFISAFNKTHVSPSSWECSKWNSKVWWWERSQGILENRKIPGRAVWKDGFQNGWAMTVPGRQWGDTQEEGQRPEWALEAKKTYPKCKSENPELPTKAWFWSGTQETKICHLSLGILCFLCFPLYGCYQVLPVVVFLVGWRNSASVI